MKRIPILLQMIPVLLWLTQPALAQKQENRPATKVYGVDFLEEKLRKGKKSKPVATLKAAFEALKKTKYSTARKLATPIMGNPAYADYGYWIAGCAEEGEALLAYRAKAYKAAIDSAKRAIALLQEVQKQNAYSPLHALTMKNLGRSEVVLGDAYAKTKKWKLAFPSYENGFEALSNGNALFALTPDSLANYAKGCEDSGSDLCPLWIQRFLFINHRTSAEYKAVADEYSVENLPTRVHGGSPHATQAYHAPDLDQEAFDEALNLYFNAKYDDAIKGFHQMLQDYPKSGIRFRARYWLGAALNQAKKVDEAEKIYEALQEEAPLTYYGMIASFATGTDIRKSIETEFPEATERDPALLPEEYAHITRAESLLTNGAKELASIELHDLKPRGALSNDFVMYLALLDYKAEAYSPLFVLLQELIQRNHDGIASSYGLRMIFPVTQYSIIEKTAEDEEIDPILVLSLMKQESAFDPGAISSSGAAGLMQLMPVTAAETVADTRRAELVDPDVNIRVGTRYLKRLMTKFNNNMVLALAAYNAGPGAVERWLREVPAKRGTLEFIESIPYKETREYVTSIMRNYVWYAGRLGTNVPKSASFFWTDVERTTK